MKKEETDNKDNLTFEDIEKAYVKAKNEKLLKEYGHLKFFGIFKKIFDWKYSLILSIIIIIPCLFNLKETWFLIPIVPLLTLLIVLSETIEIHQKVCYIKKSLK